MFVIYKISRIRETSARILSAVVAVAASNTPIVAVATVGSALRPNQLAPLNTNPASPDQR